MLEYFTYKKVKKHREQQNDKQKEKGKQIAKDESAGVKTDANPVVSNPGGDDAPIEGLPVLDHEDEQFLERLTSSNVSVAGDENETPPPLPPRVRTPVVEINSDTSSVSSKKEAKDTKNENPEQQPASKSRFAFVKALPRSISLRRKPHHLAVPDPKDQEDAKLSRVLDDLDLASRNNRAFSLSAESASLAHTFTQILRDLVNGVPTAYGDLTRLLDDSDGLLARNYARLPHSLKKLVAQLPEKLTSTLAPELLAVAAEAQGIESKKGKKFLSGGNLRDLVTKPGALIGLLKGVVNALKTRFPAFVGTNVLWSLAVFLLLFILWYCYKRGREERLAREGDKGADKGGVEGEGGTVIEVEGVDGLQTSSVDRDMFRDGDAGSGSRG